jgi:FtsP/CotA-like multicopper oxidase with cupredoxin domain
MAMCSMRLGRPGPIAKITNGWLFAKRPFLRSRRYLGLVAVAVAVLCIQTSQPGAAAQDTSAAAIPECPKEGQEFVTLPELVSKHGILREKIALVEEFHVNPFAISLPNGTGTVNCLPQLVRAFRGIDSSSGKKKVPQNARKDEAIPGPTLRSRVGDLVQLTFTNEANPNRFGGARREDCDKVGKDGEIYPKVFADSYPNCLHRSNTANIHFHGTHTNPNSTGDNVYLQIQPLPRDIEGKPTTTATEASIGFNRYFDHCTTQLKQSPLKSWPTTWADLPRVWVEKQKRLLLEFEGREGLPLWSEDDKLSEQGVWPIYYVGAFPYCFALPAKPAEEPPLSGTSPIMGQAPGTHWYHAHKHGSTAINVMEGMTGAFIIEGKYDDDLNAAYGDYVVKDDQGGETRWNTRAQKVLVLNQFGTASRPKDSPEWTLRPNALGGGNLPVVDPGTATFPLEQGVDFAVNGRLRPVVNMKPGEIQLWRIVNASARTAAYFMAPDGFEWRQLAQDGVQFAYPNYEKSGNKPFYMAPANRVDLLVKAPMKPCDKPCEVRIQNVMSRSGIMPNSPKTPGIGLLRINVAGEQPLLNKQPAEMQFLEKGQFPKQPQFLTNITDAELVSSNNIKRTLVFDSKKPLGGPSKHMINGMQFDEDDHARLDIALGATEEWTIRNLTNTKDGLVNNIDHPLHIHINPFQVTEVFDPNEKLLEEGDTGKLESPRGGSGKALAFYVTDETQLLNDYKDKDKNAVAKRQCYINPTDETTWSVEGARTVHEDNGKLSVRAPCQSQRSAEARSIWWDVFAIPSARVEGDKVIPGYYKMRSRFVDYPGIYVMHCHILIHEDRGMMFRVEVFKPKSSEVPHH